MYNTISAQDLLRFIERTHIKKLDVIGTCKCDICDIYGYICWASGQIKKQQTKIRAELTVKNNV